MATTMVTLRGFGFMSALSLAAAVGVGVLSSAGCGDGGGVAGDPAAGAGAALAGPEAIDSALPSGVTLETPTHRRRDEPQGTVGQELAALKPTVKNKKLYDAAGKEILFFKPKKKSNVTADKDYLKMTKKSTVIVLEE